MMELAMRNAEARMEIDCLKFKVDGSGWLIVPDDEASRTEAISMMFGDPPYDPVYYPESVIVARCRKTRAELDALPEWEP